jgi:cysteinyl-tRNA synthetase
VKYWLHTRLVNTGGEKMSKSAGNIYAIRDALRKFDKNELRYFFLSHHYRKDIGLEGLGDAVRHYHLLRRRTSEIAKTRGRRSGVGLHRRLSAFFEAMNDDFDTPRALDWLNKAAEDSTNASEGGGLDLDSLRAVSDILGLDLIGRS